MVKKSEVYLPDIVGGGYKDFWNFRGRYRVLKGSRGSKKSKTTALNLIWQMLCYPESNLLVVRKTYRSLRQSCFAELKWAISQFGMLSQWSIKESPLEMIFKPTNQKIYFRGLDNPMKITSITVDTGYLNFLWIEEAYELTSEADFDILDESIRGEMSGDLFKQVTLTFNPWNENHWLKKRFFDCGVDEDILAKTVTYKCNEFLDEADLRVFAKMKEQNFRRYQVAGLGNWGVSEGLIYEKWREEPFDLQEVLAGGKLVTTFGLDFGYTNDETALFCGAVDLVAKRIFVFDELYQKALSNEAIYEKVLSMGYAKERITADSAEPKSIDRLRDLGLSRIKAARKGRDSILNGIDYLQGFEILVHPQCVNFLREIANYSWAVDKFGAAINRPSEGFDHLMDAMRYAVEDVGSGERFSFW